jgi:uncharacterized protein
MNQGRKRGGARPISVHELGFDFDGVIADTAEAFVRLACRDFGYCGFRPEEITSFDPADCLPIPTAVVEEIFTVILTDSVAAALRPMAGAPAALTAMARLAPLTVITARPSVEPVYDWLERFLPAPAREGLRVVATGDHDDKLRHIQAHRLRYFIDDRAETCRRLAEGDITSFVFSQPWNRHGHGLPTVSGWDEILALIAPAGEK